MQVATLTLRADLDMVDTHPHLIFDYAHDQEKWLAEYDRAYEKVRRVCLANIVTLSGSFTRLTIPEMI